MFSQDSETKQLSILLLLSSAYKAGVASSAFARERACITIHFGTVLEKWESFTIFNEMNDRLSIDFVLSCSLLTLRDRQREPAMGIFISKLSRFSLTHLPALQPRKAIPLYRWLKGGRNCDVEVVYGRRRYSSSLEWVDVTAIRNVTSKISIISIT